MCLVGASQPADAVQRAHHLRLIQLGSTMPNAGSPAWPGRCNAHADDLYAALGGGTESRLLRNKLTERLNCNDTKGSCAFQNNAAVGSVALELSEAARSIKLELGPAPNVAAPQPAPEPLFDQKNWKSFSQQPMGLLGPLLRPDGSAILLLKATAGRTRPRTCELAPGFAKLACFDANPAMPELPVQSVELVAHADGAFAAGLTDQGLFAWDLRTGAQSDVRGLKGRLVQSGLAVDNGKSGPPPGPPEEPSPAKKASRKQKEQPKEEKEPGFVAVELKGGKAGRDTALPTAKLVNPPTRVGSQVVYVEDDGGATSLVAKESSGGRIRETARFKESFTGPFHTCSNSDGSAVATWAPFTGQYGAKPTAPSNGTELAIVFLRGGAWSKVVRATVPFDRAAESDLVCTKSGASLVWAKGTPEGAVVARVDCTADGCKSAEAKFASDAKWWRSLGTLGDAVAVVFKTGLGDTRLRVAPIAGLAAAKETILFDAEDFGGPALGEGAKSLYSVGGALIAFKGEKPVLLRIGADGSAGVVLP